MDQQNLVMIGIYLVVLCLLLVFSLGFKNLFWRKFGPVLFPIVLAALIIYNLISFPAINQPYFNWAYKGRLQRLKSNALVDLFMTSATPLKPEWIYPFIEDCYRGRTLFIPESLMGSLDLSLDRLVSQGRLAAVKIIMIDGMLAESDVEDILSLEMIVIPTNELNDDGNITKEEGFVYHFVTEGTDLDSPLLVLSYENHLFFIPEEHLADREGLP